MSNRRTMFAGIAVVLVIAIGGSFLIWSQKAKEDAQPAQTTVQGNDSQASPADPQQRVNYLISLGDRMMDDGDNVSARSYYEDALKLDPSNAAAQERIKSADRATAEK